MSTRQRVVWTLVIVALWLVFGLPFTVAGVFSLLAFSLAVGVTGLAVAAIWLYRT